MKPNLSLLRGGKKKSKPATEREKKDIQPIQFLEENTKGIKGKERTKKEKTEHGKVGTRI